MMYGFLALGALLGILAIILINIISKLNVGHKNRIQSKNRKA